MQHAVGIAVVFASMVVGVKVISFAIYGKKKLQHIDLNVRSSSVAGVRTYFEKWYLAPFYKIEKFRTLTSNGIYEPRMFVHWQGVIDEMRHSITDYPTVVSCVGPLTTAVYAGRVFSFHTTPGVTDFFHYSVYGPKEGALFNVQANSYKEGWELELLEVDFTQMIAAQNVSKPGKTSLHLFFTLDPKYSVSKAVEDAVRDKMQELGRTHMGVISVTPIIKKMMDVTPANFLTIRRDLNSIVRQFKGFDTLSVSLTGPMPVAYALGMELVEGRCKEFVGFERPSTKEEDSPVIVSFKTI